MINAFVDHFAPSTVSLLTIYHAAQLEGYHAQVLPAHVQGSAGSNRDTRALRVCLMQKLNAECEKDADQRAAR